MYAAPRPAAAHFWQGVGHYATIPLWRIHSSSSSAEHRGHIRRFQRCTLTDAQDVAIRGYVAWRQLEHSLRAAAQAVESGTDRSGKKPRK